MRIRAVPAPAPRSVPDTHTPSATRTRAAGGSVGVACSARVAAGSEAEIRSRTWQKWTFFERAAGEAKITLNNYIHERCDGNL